MPKCTRPPRKGQLLLTIPGTNFLDIFIPNTMFFLPSVPASNPAFFLSKNCTRYVNNTAAVTAAALSTERNQVIQPALLVSKTNQCCCFEDNQPCYTVSKTAGILFRRQTTVLIECLEDKLYDCCFEDRQPCYAVPETTGIFVYIYIVVFRRQTPVIIILFSKTTSVIPTRYIEDNRFQRLQDSRRVWSGLSATSARLPNFYKPAICQ